MIRSANFSTCAVVQSHMDVRPHRTGLAETRISPRLTSRSKTHTKSKSKNIKITKMETPKIRLNKSYLLEVGDKYVNACFTHHSANTQIICLFRDVSRTEGNPHWVKDQPVRGPWTKSHANVTYTDAKELVDVRTEAVRAAEEMHCILKEKGVDALKENWASQGGTVYDY